MRDVNVLRIAVRSLLFENGIQVEQCSSSSADAQPFKTFNLDKFWPSSIRKYNLLHCAAMYGCYESVQILLEEFQMNVDGRNWLQETPLMLSIRSGQHRVAHLLLNQGASATKRDVFLTTPLHWIHKIDDAEIELLLDALLEGGADINAIACRDKMVEGFQDVESDTWDVSDPDDDDDDDDDSLDTFESGVGPWEEGFQSLSVAGTALHRATYGNSPAAIECLCQKGADVGILCYTDRSGSQMTALQAAVCAHQPRLASILLQYSPEMLPLENLALLLCAITKDWTVWRMTLNGCDYGENARLTTGLCLLLLEPEFFIDSNLVLASLISIADAGCLRVLLDRNLLLSSLETAVLFRGHHLTPLQIALASRRWEIVKLLREKGANVDAGSGEEISPNCLHLCAHLGIDKPDVAEALLRFSSPSLLENPGGVFTAFHMPFMLAVQQGQFQLAISLIDHGANVDAMAPCQFNCCTSTPMTVFGQLAYSCCEASLAQFKFLMSHPDLPRKASFVVAPATGFCVLHALALRPDEQRQKRPETKRNLDFLLLQYSDDASLNHVDLIGLTALHHAALAGNYDVVHTLLIAGADPHLGPI